MKIRCGASSINKVLSPFKNYICSVARSQAIVGVISDSPKLMNVTAPCPDLVINRSRVA